MGTMATGMAFGAGSEIAHQGVRSMMGGGGGGAGDAGYARGLPLLTTTRQLLVEEKLGDDQTVGAARLVLPGETQEAAVATVAAGTSGGVSGSVLELLQADKVD